MSDEEDQVADPTEQGQSDESNAEATASEPADPSTDVPPDRLSIDPLNRHFQEEALKRGIGIRFRGKIRRNVQEYSISEGWVRMQAGKSIDRHGRPLTIKTNGPVEAWYEDLGDDPPVASKDNPG